MTMREHNQNITQIETNGFKVSVTITGDKVQIVIDDRTMEDGITVIDMYHNDGFIRIGTDHKIGRMY